MVLRLLQLRFGPLAPDIVARLVEADTETLLRWSERILNAATLNDIFAA